MCSYSKFSYRNRTATVSKEVMPAMATAKKPSKRTAVSRLRPGFISNYNNSGIKVQSGRWSDRNSFRFGVQRSGAHHHSLTDMERKNFAELGFRDEESFDRSMAAALNTPEIEVLPGVFMSDFRSRPAPSAQNNAVRSGVSVL